MNLNKARRPDPSAFGGLVVAIAGIAGGLALEQGALGDLVRLTPALIVFGGTLGAVLVNFPLRQIWRATLRLRDVFLPAPPKSVKDIIDRLCEMSARARRNGLLVLEDDIDTCDEPFLKKGLEILTEGTASADARHILEIEACLRLDEMEEEARIFESAGGYAPTIGILGAVLGLIQTLKYVDKIDKVGPGIAIAFVATIYGVGSANLIFLPFAGRIRSQARALRRIFDLNIQGLCGIADGVNTRSLRNQLESFLEQPAARPAAGPAGAAAVTPPASGSKAWGS